MTNVITATTAPMATTAKITMPKASCTPTFSQYVAQVQEEDDGASAPDPVSGAVRAGGGDRAGDHRLDRRPRRVAAHVIQRTATGGPLPLFRVLTDWSIWTLG